MSNLVHLIDNNGNKKVVESHCLNESINDKYQIDFEWYLSNGYTPLEDALKEIEGEYYDRIK